MTLPRSHFALLVAVPHTVRYRGRVAHPGSVGWERHFPELPLMGDIDIVSQIAEPAGMPRWRAIADWVGEHGYEYDGIIIVHDRDLLLPGAVALDLQLSAVDMPIVITVPSRIHPDDWRTNVVVALQTAAVEVPGPLVLDGNRIVRAGTVRWELPEVIGGASAARLDFGVRRVPARHRTSRRPTIHTLSNELTVVDVRPGLALPVTPRTPTSWLLRSTSTPDWSALRRWSQTLPYGSRVILQWPGRHLPAPLRAWGHIGHSEDDIAIIQAAWAFGRGEQWKRGLQTALERRPL